MKKKDMVLHIKMFGKFSMQNAYYTFPQEKKKSMQVGLLMAYLLANRNVETSKSKLIEVLWPEDDSGNPEGALRNLVYRARKEIQKFFPQDVDDTRDSIVLRRDSYLWQPAIPCEIDTDRFEEYCKQVSVEQGALQKYEYCEKAIDLYTGEFLQEYAAEQWVVFRSVYYKRLYTNCIFETCHALIDAHCYQEVIDLCDKAGMLDQLDVHVHEMKMLAYLHTGNPQRALAYYDQIVDLYFSCMGMDVPESMKEVYELVVDSMSNQKPVDVDELEQHLKEEQANDGTFYCNYDVFRNIYQINVRAARRALRSRFLALLTLIDTGGGVVEEASELLKTVISEQLRKNDVFSQYNMTQYSVILAAQNADGCRKAIDRICEKFGQKNRDEAIRLEYEIKQIK